MKPLEIIYGKARQNKKRVILPEADDKRVFQAASKIADLNLAKPILLGEPDKILKQSKEIDGKINLDKVRIVDYLKDPRREEFIESFYEMIKSKAFDKDKAEQFLNNPLYFGAMMVAKGAGDCMVAGAANTTADVFRAAFQIIKPSKDMPTVSSYFLMIIPDCSYGENGLFLFADAGIIPDPSSKQLANIAISTARNMSLLLNYEPKVAMLSFSTKDSAKHKTIEKIQKATEILKEKCPDLIVDGELQVDAAIIPEVAAQKAPSSSVRGKANILIFPDLSSGNISYKLVERLAKAEAYGPVLQGLNKPVSDLSRGCSTRDVINCSAIVAASCKD